MPRPDSTQTDVPAGDGVGRYDNPEGSAGADEEDDGSPRKWLFVGLGLLALGIGAFVLLYVLRPTAPAAEPPPQTPLVRTAPVEVRSGALRVQGNGTVGARAEIGLTPQVSGRVVYVNPALVSGGQVEAGEVLVRLDPRDYRARVDQAQAQVAQRRVDLERARAERAIALAEFRSLQQQGVAGTDGARYEGDFVPRAPGVDAAFGTDLFSDTTDISPLALNRPQLEAARAALEGARAQLREARLALERTTIEAPFDAQVRSEQVDVGQYVSPQQNLARLYSADAVEIVVPLTDEKAALIPRLWALRAGAGDATAGAVPAVVSTDYGGRRFEWAGYVDRARAFVDEQTRTIDVVVRVPRPFETRAYARPRAPEVALPAGGAPLVSEPPLLVGMYTTVSIEGQQVEGYAVVPRDALRAGDEVWVVRRDSLLFTEPVEVIQEVDNQVYLLAPALGPDDRVVTSDLEIVTDSMKVRVAQDSVTG